QRSCEKPKYPLETPLIPTTNQPHMRRERGLNPDRSDETRVYKTPRYSIAEYKVPHITPISLPKISIQQAKAVDDASKALYGVLR
ncbi:hypothetical protein DPMN_070194, partial [Dreissena polymorpha]